MKIEKILFPTDFSERSEEALPHALWLAEEFGAELHLLHAVVLHAADPANPELSFPDLAEAYREIGEWAADRMQEAAGRLDRPGVEVRQVQRRGIAPAPVVLEYAREEDIDLVVMATHGRRGVRRMLLGSVAEEVLRGASCPVLTMRPAAEGTHPEPPRRILVPVDFSEHSDLALSYGGELADRTGAELLALHVIPELAYPDPYFAEAAAFRAMTKAAREEVPEALAGRVDEVLGEEADVTTRLEVGRPAAVIAEFAEEEDVDLVVMGSHGRSGVERAFLGSVAEGVVRRASCPVLTVKTTGKDLRGS